MTAPRVALVIEHEATPRIVVEAESKADEKALRAWVRYCRPDLAAILAAISREIQERNAA